MLLTPIWMFVILISVLLLGAIFGLANDVEGFEKTSQILEFNLSVARQFFDAYDKPIPPNAPPGAKELMDKSYNYIEYFVTDTTELIAELATTTDTTKVDTYNIDAAGAEFKKIADELKSKTPASTNGQLSPQSMMIIAISMDLTGLKQLAGEVPKSIFDKFINIKANTYNGLFTLISDIIAIAKVSDPTIDNKFVIDTAGQYIKTIIGLAPGAVKLLPTGTPFNSGPTADTDSDDYKGPDDSDDYKGPDDYGGPDDTTYDKKHTKHTKNGNASDYYKWYWYWNTDGGSKSSRDYILKSQVIPPVCPVCPACPIGACTNCGGNGGSGTIGSDGKSVVPKPGDIGSNVTGLAKDTVSGATGLIRDTASQGAGLTKDAISGGIGLTKDVVSGGVGLTKDVVNSGVGLAKDAVSGGVGLTKDIVSGGVGLTKDIVSGGVGLAKDTVNSGVGLLKGTVSGATDLITTDVKGVYTTGPMNPYTYNGALHDKGTSKFIPLTADFSAFGR